MPQETFVCFLRGINVGGKNMIKMKDLTDLFIKSGFSDVTTYLQSGNVVFNSPSLKKPDDIEERIEKSLDNNLNLKVHVLVKGAGFFITLPGRNPFLKSNKYEMDKLHITMLEGKPSIDGVGFMMKNNFAPEEFQISGSDVFLYCPEGYGRAKLNNNFLEKKLESVATTRNWKTILNLRDIIINQYS